MDSNVRQLIWDGAIPLEIHINDPENILTAQNTTNRTAHLPFYVTELLTRMMARRLIYLPMLVNEIKRHFGSLSRTFTTDGDDFSFEIGSGDLDDRLSLTRRSVSSSPLSSRGSVDISNSAISPCWWFTCKFNENDLLVPLHLSIGLIYDLVACLKDTEDLLPWKLEFHLSNQQQVNSVCTVLESSINYTPFSDESALSSFYFSALKEADHLRSGSARNVMNLTRSEQLQLWEALKGGECDRFWRINQKLINFSPRSVPIRFWLISPDSQVSRFQFPIPEAATQTLQSLLESEFKLLTVKRAILHGVHLPLNVSLEELNYNWNYADNFLQIILIT